eukprot:3004550-Rhodomonas_salina.6
MSENAGSGIRSVSTGHGVGGYGTRHSGRVALAQRTRRLVADMADTLRQYCTWHSQIRHPGRRYAMQAPDVLWQYLHMLVPHTGGSLGQYITQYQTRHASRSKRYASTGHGVAGAEECRLVPVSNEALWTIHCTHCVPCTPHVISVPHATLSQSRMPRYLSTARHARDAVSASSIATYAVSVACGA